MSDEALQIKITAPNSKDVAKTLGELNSKVLELSKNASNIDLDNEKTKEAAKAFEQLTRTMISYAKAISETNKVNRDVELNEIKIAQAREKSAIAIEKMKNKHTELMGVYDQQKLELKRLEMGLREFIASGNTNKSTLNALGNEYKNLQAKIKDTDNKFKELTTTQEKAKKSSFSLKIAMANFAALQIDRIVSNIGYAMLEFAKSCSKAGVELDALRNTFMAATGGWQQGAQEMKWLIGMSNNLGIAFGDVSDSYAKFMTSFTRSGGTIQQSRQIFEDLSTAMVSLHLPAERMQGVFIALEQMANKGTVQAEELKRQLGNALPGAFELAAESMGILPKQLMDMMKKGEVFSKDFLPAFAATVKDALGQSIGIASEQFNANMNRLKTATDLFKMSLGQLINLALLPFIKALIPLMNTLAQATTSFNDFAQAVFVGNSAEKYMGMSAQIVQLTKSVAGLNLENEESKRIFQENAAILPELSKYILELNKNFVDLSDAELRHIASMGKAEAMEQILSDRTKELNSWQNTLQATWNVVWTNIKNITVGVAKGIWEVLKQLGQAISEWFQRVFGGFIDFYKQISTTARMIKGELDYKKSFNKAEYNKGFFDNFKNAIQSEKNMIALEKTAKAMDNLGASTKNTYSALKMAQISAQGLGDEKTIKKVSKGTKGAKGYQKTEAEKEWTKEQQRLNALGAKIKTGKATEVEVQEYINLKNAMDNAKSSLKELTMAESDIFNLKQQRLSQLENEIKLGIYQGQNVEALVAEYNREKVKMEEVNNAFSSLTGNLQDGWKREESELKKLRAEYKYMVTHVNEFTDAEIKQVQATLKSQEALSSYAKTMAELEKPMEITKRHAKDLGNNLIDGLLDVVDGSKSFWEAFAEIGKTTLKNYASDMMKRFLDEAVAAFAAGNAQGGIMSGFTNIFKSIFGMGISSDNSQNPMSQGGSSSGGTGLFSPLIQEAETLSTTLLDTTSPALDSAVSGLTFLGQASTSTTPMISGLSQPISGVANQMLSLAGSAPIVAMSTMGMAASMGILAPACLAATPALNGMATALAEIAAVGEEAALAMAQLAVANAANSVAQIPMIGGFLAPVAAAATGAGIAAGMALAGVGVAAGSVIGHTGIALGKNIGALGNASAGALGKLGGGKVVAHAKGGVVSSPTTFPMSGGNIGLAGEAGTEVIAPARRMSNGEVGVGAVQPKVTVNNYTNAAVEVIKRPDNEMEIKIRELNAMLSSSRTNKGFTSAQQRLSTKGKQIG